MAARKKQWGHGGARPGAGRPRELYDPVPFRVNLEREDRELLREMADELDTSATGLARGAIIDMLTRFYQKRRRRK